LSRKSWSLLLSLLLSRGTSLEIGSLRLRPAHLRIPHHHGLLRWLLWASAGRLSIFARHADEIVDHFAGKVQHGEDLWFFFPF
jgi:hypothetical protein